MTSFRSNLNSVSNTYSLTAIINHITTCFNHWRRKSHKNLLDKKSNCKNQQKRGLPFYCNEFYPLQRTANANLQNLNVKLKEIFSRKFHFPEKVKNKNCKFENVAIIAKLLSSTLIGGQTTNNPLINFGNTTTNLTNKTATVEDSSEMTILEDTFLLIRHENPDLDAEIRGILLARAQTGATIGEIREDYRKNTGGTFPVFENVTDFLLCIPGVSVFCNDRGTRIFNVKPTERTKHLHHLIMHQKAPSERSTMTAYSSHRSTGQRDSGYNSLRAEVVPLSWRSNYNHIRPPPGFELRGPRATTEKSQTNPDYQRQQQRQSEQVQNIVEPPSNTEEEGTPQSDSERLEDNRNGYYQDNCQYLFNRIYNNFETNKSNSTNENLDNRSESNAQLNAQNLAYQDSLLNANNHDIDIFKRPTVPTARRTALHSSSPSNPNTDSMSTASSELNYDAHLLDFPLLGDDFFLYLARMELKCKFKKNERVLQSGLCASGQTIKVATKRVGRLPYNSFSNRRIIINIGSVDIMQGKTLVQIEHDFRKLINVVRRRGMIPIITTLAPLANYGHDSTVKTKLERFNEFLKREGPNLLVIDIWSSFVNERRQTLFDCYQHEPRQVTGANESYVFWNKIGRQRVLQIVEAELEY